FTVRLFTSFLQAVGFRDRYLLMDGYHRAVSFLRQGVNVVPALVREVRSFEELNPRRGMLPPSVVLGNNPPFLPDYLDEDVSASVELPETQRVIVIQGLELSVVE